VYTLVFALIAVVGAWTAWRANPLFSIRATVRFVGIVGLALAVVVAIVVAAVSLTAHSSQTVVFVTLGIALTFGTMGLIWVLVAVSTPPVAAFSKSISLTRVHRNKLVPWARRFCWLLAVLGLLAVVVPGDNKVIVYTIGGLFVFLGIILLFTGYIAALGLDRSLTSVEADSWLHWHYTAEAWKAWSDVLIARYAAMPRLWSWDKGWKFIAVPLTIVTVAIFVESGDDLPLQWKAASAVMLWAFMIGTVEVLNRFEKTAPLRLHRLLMNAPPDAYFGAAGLFADGVYSQWITPGSYLLSATIDERAPRSLTFLFQKYVGGTSGWTQVAQSVLVPEGAGHDIARLQTALSGANPKATVQLS
jgi:hypothetical protein